MSSSYINMTEDLNLGKPIEILSFLLFPEEATTKEVLEYFIAFCGSGIESLLGSEKVSVKKGPGSSWLANVPDGAVPDEAPPCAVELEKVNGIYELRIYGGRLPNEISMFEFLRYCSAEYAKKDRV